MDRPPCCSYRRWVIQEPIQVDSLTILPDQLFFCRVGILLYVAAAFPDNAGRKFWIIGAVVTTGAGSIYDLVLTVAFVKNELQSVPGVAVTVGPC